MKIRLILALFASAVVVLAGEGEGTPKDTDPKPADALSKAADEFKILTRKEGMRPDSPVATRQQSGPKMLWHGRLYENFRNDFLDAIPHEVRQNGENKSTLRRNQFGFNVGGPLFVPKLMKNRNDTFFSLSYEGVRENIDRARLATVPIVPERTGNFFDTVDQSGNQLPIYDPATTRPNANFDPSQPVSTSNLQYLRTPFPQNRIPTERLDPAAMAALALYPEPNTAIGPFFQNNYFVNSPATNIADGVIAKVDHSFGDKHRVTWDGSLSNGFLGSARYFPNGADPGSPDHSFANRHASLEYVYTASPQTVNTASMSVSSNTSLAETAGGTHAFPRYDFAPYLSMGTEYPNSRNASNTFEFRDGLSTRYKKHSLRFSLVLNQHEVNSLVSAYPSGYYLFDPGLTSLPGIVNTGYGFASFMLGLPSDAQRTIVIEPSYWRHLIATVGVSDKYELRKDLTITIGLSFSRHAPRVEKYNRQSTVSPEAINPSNGLPGALVFAGQDGVPDGLRPVIYRVNPSAGIAWNPLGDSKTVVRANYARSHSQIPLYSGQFGTQGFNARQTFVSPNAQLTPAVILSQGIPPFQTKLPDLSPSAADDTIADWIDLSDREPLYQSASLSVERELPLSMVVSGGASYSGGRDLLMGDSAANPNAIPPAALVYADALNEDSFRATVRPFPQYQGFEVYGLYPGGRYQRNAGFLRLEKRASFGLSLTAYYEFSKQMDDYSSGVQDFVNRRNDWSLTSYNPQQYVQLGYVYELPFGANKPLLNYSDWRRPIVTGWSFTGTAYWNNGTPLILRPSFNNTGTVISTLYVNTVPGVNPAVSNPSPALWFNPAAFDQPADFTLGDASATSSTLRNPGIQSMDLSVNKRLPLGTDRAVEFSASAFDVLNHANWNYPDTTIGPASAPNVNAGKIIGSHGSRVVQLGLKFSF